MLKQELINRWKNSEGQKLLKEIIRCLNKGESLVQVNGLTKYSGRWDLRGAKLSEIESEQKIKAPGHSFLKKKGTLKVKNTVFESADVSFADMSYSVWKKCEISNCLFDETTAKEIHIINSAFFNCAFRKANLSNSFINDNIGSSSGLFKGVEFLEVNLSKSSFRFPKIQNCTFLNCNLKETNFDGSRFENCKFTGILDSTFFRGYSLYAQKSILGVFNRVNPKDFPNLMINVDFREAILKGVLFTNSIDLSQCKFPQSDDYVIVNDLNKVYNLAKEIIDKEWHGDDKRKGISLIDNLYFAPYHQNQFIDLIDKYIMIDENGSKEFGEKFFNLIRSINNSQKNKKD